MPNKEIIKDYNSTYLKTLENSLGSRLWQNLYIIDKEGKKRDVLRGGELSCAYYVSSILNMFGFIESPHATVNSTIKDIENSGYTITNKPKQGDIILWEAKIDQTDNTMHQHIGFVWLENTAISNSAYSKFPIIHDLTFQGSRKIKGYYSKK